jgi:Common central domain of tyrosinase
VAIGDGIRRNLATIDQSERNRLRDAFVGLNERERAFPGERDDPIPGGVTLWFKQDEIHAATHVHSFPGYRGIGFLPWHRELCNRLEGLLRTVDPDVSLHYWDWNTDPIDLFVDGFMGSAEGPVGEPWLGAGFYDPDADPARDISGNPFDPPRTLFRNKAFGAPAIGQMGWPTDAEILEASTFPEMRKLLEDSHAKIHGYIGGTIGDPHQSFRDPFVFLLHSNVDRLFAMWQTQPGQSWRLDPDYTYGSEGDTDLIPGAPVYDPGILTPLDPWAGNPTNTPLVHMIRPWAPPENEQVVKNSRHPSVVEPPLYDTLPPEVERGEWLEPVLHVMLQ